MAKPTKLDPATLRWALAELEGLAADYRELATRYFDADDYWISRAHLLEGLAQRFRARATRAERKAGRDG